MRLAVVRVGDVPAAGQVRAAPCLCSLQTCDEVSCPDLDAAEIDDTCGADGGGHTYFADRRPALSGAISRPAE